ncbi:MAG TPA: Calx-beta domain-containing protein [Pyrinomonadaceae bacterium]
MKNFRRVAISSLLLIAVINALGLSFATPALSHTVNENIESSDSFAQFFISEFSKPGFANWLADISPLAVTTYTVNSTADTNNGACTTGVNGCTLREAIIAANANAGADTIQFSLGAGSTINLLSQLPAITEAVTINGSSVILNGTSAGAGVNGLLITGPNVHINSLNIIGFSGAAIRLEGAGSNVVQGCRLGRTSTSEPTTNANGTGVFIASSPNNIINGTDQRNILSGNNDGVRIEGAGATGNIVKGNYIGTDTTGATDIGNKFNGVVIISAPNNTVGSDNASEKNYISGNDQNGVAITNAGASGNIIKNNVIGRNVQNQHLGNTVNGVFVLNGATNNFIGTATAGNRFADNGDGIHIKDAITTGNKVLSNEVVENVRNGVVFNNAANNDVGPVSGSGENIIAANGQNGVAFTGAAATGNHVQGNTIGLDMGPFAPNFVGNTQNGVIFVSSASNNAVTNNTINANLIDGIRVESGTSNNVAGNSLSDNTGLGINLGTDGVTVNDTGDADTGPNNLQNFPILTVARASTTVVNDQLIFTAHVEGNLNSAPNTTYTIGIYANTSCDSSGNGEGERFFGSFTVTTGSNGNAVINNNLTGSVSAAGVVTATATDASNNTSEFSPCIATSSAQSGSLQFSMSNYNVNESAGSAVVTVLRQGGSDGAVTVGYETSNITATAGQDYTAVSGTLSFAAGETTKTFSIPIANDTLDEPDEIVHIGLRDISGGASYGAVNAGSVTIIDNDAPPTLSITDASVTEGDTSDQLATFTIKLSAASGQTVSVHYATADGTAIAGNDYVPEGETIDIGAGQTQKTFTVIAIPDTVDESNENFFVNLSSPVNATIADSQGVGTIIDNDAAGAFRFSAATYDVSEGVGSATITVTRTGGTAEGVSVNFATSNGTATGGADYDPQSGTLSFGAGETSKTFGIGITDDTLYENNETINLTLSGPTGGATLGTPSTAVLTITNNDATPVLSIDDVTVAEGNSGTSPATFTVSLANATALTTTVHYATANGTAVAPDDYAATSGTLTFSAGEMTKTISVVVNGDTNAEGSETFTVNLSAPTNATIGDAQGTGTIMSDDLNGVIQFAPANYTQTEGGANTISLRRLGGTQGLVTVNYATANGTASAGQDYTAASGTITFNSGQEFADLNISSTQDLLDEANETFTITLTNPTGGATLGSANTATITISDDDQPPTITLTAFSTSEGNSGTSSGSFNVHLSAPSGQIVTANFVTSDGTATAGQDYVTRSITFSVPAGAVNTSTSVMIIGDTIVEPDETVVGTISNPTNATIAQATAVLTILNDDSEVTPSPSPTPGGNTVQFSSTIYSAFENQHLIEVTVTRAGDTSTAASVAYQTIDGSATQRNDYTATFGTLTFAPGEVTKKIDVLITDDTYMEPDESCSFELHDPSSGLSLGSPSSTVLTIVSDDLSSDLPNALDDAGNFVREHYHDFLGREPDASGLAFWTNQITECEQLPEAQRAQCREIRRINVSAAFFLSIEFQETGYLAYRCYVASLDRPNGLPRYREIMQDTQALAHGVVVGEGDWRAQLEANKQAFAQAFVQRGEFITKYPTVMNPANFVDALYAHAALTPFADERQAAIAEFGGASNTADADARARVLRRVGESDTLRQRELNRAFVLAEYFGYLRRNPDEAPDSNLDGYNFWLRKLNDFGGNYVQAEMVKAFLASGEYRHRFGK